MGSHVWTFIACVAITATLAATQTPKCDDVDTSACQLLQTQRHDFCKDEALVRSICPRFCKLCPIECYHCDTTYTDYRQCNTTVLCQSGEVCMKKELISFSDGHHEYEMTCQDKSICDGGNDLTIPFGKRHVNSRDISVTCCVDDLCNYPVQTTTTTTTTTSTTTTATTTKRPECPKDVIFMLDVSNHYFSGFNRGSQRDTDYRALITSVVQRLDIGTNANLVGLYVFDESLHTKFDIGHYTDKSTIISHINSYYFFNGTHGSNTTHAIHTLLQRLNYHSYHHGEHHSSYNSYYRYDRVAFPDAIVIIGSEYTTSHLSLTASDKQNLQQTSTDVIVLDVQSRVLWGQTPTPHDDLLATDNNHIIHTPTVHTGIDSIVDKLYQLILEC